ncbi:hypothetical protein EIP86_002992 [Pleurotus ostreatoroseus]|nr:hypothetical protein EIP86_002992 [Pleurotus ostreatoroseus]
MLAELYHTRVGALSPAPTTLGPDRLTGRRELRERDLARVGSAMIVTSSLPDVQYDPYYNLKDLAEICAHFVTHVFSCPEVLPASSRDSLCPPLSEFIAYALHRTQLHHTVTFTALFLLLKLRLKFPDKDYLSGPRLFLCALMVASKVINDDTYSNRSWTTAGQHFFPLRDLNSMERALCLYLEWELNVDPTDLQHFESKVRADFKGSGPYPQYTLPSLALSLMPSVTLNTSKTIPSLPAFVTSRLSPPSVARERDSRLIRSQENHHFERTCATPLTLLAYERDTQMTPSSENHHLEHAYTTPPISAAYECESQQNPSRECHHKRAYATPPTSPDTPNTLEASRTVSASPASSASPQTPTRENDNAAQMATQGGSVLMAIEPCITRQRLVIASNRVTELRSRARLSARTAQGSHHLATV